MEQSNIIPLTILQNEYNEMFDYVDGLIFNIPEKNIDMQVSEWAETKRSLSSGLSALPGPYRFERTPYIREIVDCLSESSPVREIAVMKGTQIAFTVGVSENHIGYCVDNGIGPLLFVSGDQAMAEEQMEKRVDQMIESAGLQEKIKPIVTKRHQKTTGDRKEVKSYGGTFMRAIGPNSESKARSFPARVVHLDEIDVYPQNLKKGHITTGNPIEKITRRTDSYEYVRKILYGSTPKNKSTSQIEPLFKAGDMRYYNVPCIKCGEVQPLIWANVKWDKNKDGKLDIIIKEKDGIEVITKDPVYYECSFCKAKWKNYDKYWFLQESNGAEWIPTKKPDRPGLRSYHISSLYGFRSWLNIVIQFLRVKDDPLLFPDFVNDVWGVTWEERIDAPDSHKLMQYAEDWEAGFINEKVIFLTLAADIQQDRIECGLVGWGNHKESWFIDYWNIPGNPQEIEDICWKELGKILETVYKRADNAEMNIQLAFIDKQYLSDQVNTFCEGYDYHPDQLTGVFPVLARERMITTTKTFKSDIKTPIIGMDDQKIKFALYNTLRKKPHRNGFPYGYMHFPQTFGEEFYKQLTNEEVFIETMKNGTKKITIENRKQRRNEVLDVAKYCMGGFQFAYDRFFEIENKKRKDQKRKEIPQDIDVFMLAMEESLF